MAIVELIMPKMGESIIEATIINWLKKEGDHVEEDETILEVATDKVDSEVPSSVSGTIVKLLHHKDDVVSIGKPLALIETDGTDPKSVTELIAEPVMVEEVEIVAAAMEKTVTAPITPIIKATATPISDRFYSPLVKNIAKTERISNEELDKLMGSGPNGRVVKEDLFDYLQSRQQAKTSLIDHPKVGSGHVRQGDSSATTANPEDKKSIPKEETQKSTPLSNSNSDYEIVEMDRMRRLISDHMIHSQKTSATVSSFIEVDVTHIVHWRNRFKDDFQQKYGEKLTYSPLFVEAVAKALKDFPKINASLSGDQIILKKHLNIGIATALESGNLIVPVIKNCEELNLVGLTKKLNDLTARARTNKLRPDEIKDGTFTISNIGTFDNIMGTPIINQPELAILAIGAIKKKPVIIETEHGDIIAIRHMMFLSLSFDHRVVDGYLGGTFLKRIAEYIEKFDSNRDI